jgi:hypothetical protein
MAPVGIADIGPALCRSGLGEAANLNIVTNPSDRRLCLCGWQAGSRGLSRPSSVGAMVEGLRDILSSVFEASTLLERQRQGTITRRLAAWAAILAVPTAIAGIYGMTFVNMPELQWKYGYFLVAGG